MGKHVQFLRIKKLVGANIITVAAKHNLRELQTEIGADSHIDASRTCFNAILAGASTAAGVALAAQTLMDNDLLRPLRRDAVRGLEIVFGLPADSGINEQAFFSDCVVWAEQYFETPLISAVVHNDEAAPHCHVILLPLFNGRMIGNGLVGYRSRLNAIQTAFHERVGAEYGLIRQASSKRIPVAIRRTIAEQVIATFRFNPSRINEPSVKTALLELLVTDPMAVAQAIGLDALATKGRDNAIVFEGKRNAIAFDSNTNSVQVSGTQKGQTLSCVVFGIPEQDLIPVIPPLKMNQSPLTSDLSGDVETKFVRIPVDDYIADADDLILQAPSGNPDSGIPAQYWDSDLGEFIAKPVRHRKAVQI